MRRLLPLKMLRVAVALAAVLAIAAAGQLPASAHDDKVFHGKDFALVYSDHKTVALCDEEKDGHWVSAVLYSGASNRFEMFNTNGADGDCVVETMPWTIDTISVCEENKGCTTDSF